MFSCSKDFRNGLKSAFESYIFAFAPTSQTFQDGRQGSDFYLVQMYPRREFPDVTKTFAELELTPSATILVISVSFQIASSNECWT